MNSYNPKTTVLKGAVPAGVIVAGGNALQFIVKRFGGELDGETALTIFTGVYSAFRMLFNLLKNRKRSGF